MAPDRAHVAVVVDRVPARPRHVARVLDHQNDRAIRAHADGTALIVVDDHAHAAVDPDHR